MSIQRPKTYLMFCSHKCKLQTRRVDLKYVFLYTPFPQGLYIAMRIPITNVGGRTINTYSHNYETTIQNASSTKVRYKYRFICQTTNNLSIFDIQVFFLHPRHIILNITIYNSGDMSFKKSNHLKYIPSLELGLRNVHIRSIQTIYAWHEVYDM